MEVPLRCMPKITTPSVDTAGGGGDEGLLCGRDDTIDMGLELLEMDGKKEKWFKKLVPNRMKQSPPNRSDQAKVPTTLGEAKEETILLRRLLFLPLLVLS